MKYVDEQIDRNMYCDMEITDQRIGGVDSYASWLELKTKVEEAKHTHYKETNKRQAP